MENGMKVLKVECNANDEMVQGYFDGFDLDSPEPSANRSRSYRHGFANGRSDKKGISRGLSYQTLVAQAEEAMRLDALDAHPTPQ